MEKYYEGSNILFEESESIWPCSFALATFGLGGVI